MGSVTEMFQNLNPVTRKYLEQIERAYAKRSESIGSDVVSSFMDSKTQPP